MAQSLGAVYAGLVAAIGDLYVDTRAPDGSLVLTTHGHPGPYQPSAIVAVMDTQGAISRPTLGPNRTRELAAQITVVISVCVLGDADAMPVALDAATGLLTQLEQFFGIAANERLGNDACRDSWVDGIKVTGSLAYDEADSSIAIGRIVDIDATVTALIRYNSNPNAS